MAINFMEVIHDDHCKREGEEKINIASSKYSNEGCMPCGPRALHHSSANIAHTAHVTTSLLHVLRQSCAISRCQYNGTALTSQLCHMGTPVSFELVGYHAIKAVEPLNAGTMSPIFHLIITS